MSRRDAANTQDPRVQWLDTSKDFTILTQNKYLNITQILNICPKYLWPHANQLTTRSSRGLGLVKRLHYLICYHGGLSQILIELIISAIRLCTLPKCIQTSGWPVRIHQPEYMTHVLTGGCGDCWRSLTIISRRQLDQKIMRVCISYSIFIQQSS